MKLTEYAIQEGGTAKIGCPIFRRIAEDPLVDKSPATIYMIALGHKVAGESLCMRIEAATNGAVTCEELRDDVPWHILRGNAPRQPSEAA